jgi:ABC-2 type transport system ATP-binding protein
VLSASHLTRRFGARVAVDDVSFSVAPGEILALLGPNGAGKTTTLRMLAGLIEPSSGAVQVGDRAMSRQTAPALRSRIGFLTETPGLWDRLSIRHNLLVYARLHGLPDPDAAVDRTLDFFNLGDRAAQPAAELSKGLRQRVALGRTLLHDPAVVLLDEPTSGLDPESARDVRELVLRLKSERRAVLLCTHNLDEVERVADTVAVIRTRLVAVDTPAALRSRLFVARVRIGLSNDGPRYAAMLRSAGGLDVTEQENVLSVATDHAGTPALVRMLVEAGAAIEWVTPETPPLEEVYLRLIDADRSVS